MNETRIRRVTAFLSVYLVTRHYGGPEEGGWWYDAYEHTGASFPYSAEVTEDWMELLDLDVDTSTAMCDYDHEEGKWMRWTHNGELPTILDEATRVRVESARMHFIDLYGEPGTSHRGSMAQRADDYVFVHELVAGDLANRPIPHYE